MKPPVLAAELIDDRPSVSMRALCRLCRVDAAWVSELVEEGVLQPSGEGPLNWRFDAHALRRARLARRLQRDFELNVTALALVVDLIEEVQRLRRVAGRW
ncbi:MAG: MerR family transcriptional regulator [Gammaproteobacteria bacterium]|nr:MAG: MerR family transcriptional regulator [Gammaproteobacteria bacterium]